VEDELKRYKVLLYERGTPDEFNWSETELSGFLGNRFGVKPPSLTRLPKWMRKARPRARLNTRWATLPEL
jgi:hypothetical protein